MRRHGLWRHTLAAALLARLPAFAQGDGALDPSFHFDGRLTISTIADELRLRAVAAAPDGRLVVAGTERSASWSLYWAAVDDAGEPAVCDLTIPGGANLVDPRAAAFDTSGRLVLAGIAGFPGEGLEGFAARFLYPDCVLDTSFHEDGVYRTDSPKDGTYFQALAFDSSQRIVLAGETSAENAVVVRLLASNGNPDPTFDGDGVRHLDLATQITSISSVAIQPDDRIVLAGGVRRSGGLQDIDFLAVRLDPAGGLDGTFSGDGVHTIGTIAGADETANALVLDPETGRILLAGVAIGLDPIVLRLTAGGTLDLTFGTSGRWRPSGFDIAGIEAASRQSDGRYLLAGWGKNAATEDRDFVAWRLTPEGALDPTFSNDGAAVVAFDEGGMNQDTAYAVALDGGRPVLAGQLRDGAGEILGGVARLESALVFTDGFERGSTGGWSSRTP